MATTIEAIKDRLHDWAKAVGGAGYGVQFEDEDLPDTKAPRIDIKIATTKLAPNPIASTTVPAPTELVPNPDGVERLAAEVALDVIITVRGKAAMAMAHKLIISLKSRTRYMDNPAGLWQIMGLGGVISDPVDLSALETSATLSRVEFRVRFHAEVDYTDAGDYIKTTQATIKETEKGTIAVVTLGPDPHPIPEECN